MASDDDDDRHTISMHLRKQLNKLMNNNEMTE